MQAKKEGQTSVISQVLEERKSGYGNLTNETCWSHNTTHDIKKKHKIWCSFNMARKLCEK